MSIQDPQNPLFGRENTSGRGYTKYTYTVQDVAKVSGRAVGTVRNDVAKGKLDLDSLESVVAYISGVRG